MTTKDFTANVISATKVVPDGNFKDSKASGIWDINEALDLIKVGNWPNVANVNPAAFVDALFQTHLYDGTSGNLSIDNDINLSGSGGLVWFKDRNYGNNHRLYDTARGVRKYLDSSANAAEATNSGSGNSNGISAFNSNGFTIGNDGYINDSSSRYVSWTFRKQPNFFDVVTYAGNGTSGREITHNLGTTVGAIFVKSLNNTRKWSVFHRGMDASNPSHYKLHLDQTDARADEQHIWNDTEPTSSVFTVGSDGEVNANGENYVAYLFAHNNDDGGFGEPGDQDIIKCGSYTGNGNATGPVVDLGFEPQWLIVKNSTASGSNWLMVDNMRGVATGGDDKYLIPNASSAEGAANVIDFNATGFSLKSTGNSTNSNGATYIYMAIRRGGMQTPTAASDVFSIVQNTNTLVDNTKVDFGIVPDMHIANRTTSGMSHFITNRLTGGKYMFTNANSAEDSTPLSSFNEEQTTVEYTGTAANDSGTYNHIGWKRARGFFDVVAWTGAAGSLSSVKHSLGVKPDLVILKYRGAADSWYVYNSATTGVLTLDGNGATSGSTNYMASTTATDLNVSLVSNPANSPIAYLFATVAGVSKVGSVSHSGSSTDVDCGFTSGASLVIMKRTDDTGSWLLFDSVRGIIAGNSPYLKLQAATAEVTSVNILNPLSSGFQIPDDQTDGDYIFYAIAAIS